MHSDLAAGRERLLLAAEGDWPYRRGLTDVEAASGVDVPDLDHAGQLALERMLAAWHPMREAHVIDLLGKIDAALLSHPPGDTTWIDQLELPALNVARLVAGVEAAVDAGYALALDEARRQAPELAAIAVDAKRADHAGRIHAYALGAERLLARSLVQTASREAFRLTATTDDVDTRGHVATVLGDSVMLYERDILQGMATGAVTEGRYEVMEAILGQRTSQLEAAEPQHAGVYALEILDGNTCSECDQIDGQEYQSLAEARVDYPGIGGGYIRCLGRERCRGTLVIVYATEAPPTQTVPTPDPPPPPGTPVAPVPPPPVTPTTAAAPVDLDAVLAAGTAIHDAYLAELALAPGAPDAIPIRYHRKALREALKKAGVNMGDGGDIAFTKTTRSTDAIEPQVHIAAAMFPSRWTQLSNDFGQLIVDERPGRAGYKPAITRASPVGRTLGVTLDGQLGLDGNSISVAIHEMAHRMEQIVPGLTEAEAAFKARRNTRGETPHTMPGYDPSEVFIEDDFAIFYTGKSYAEMLATHGYEPHEILSVGMEALAGQQGRDWDDVRADADHMRFILGLLAALA